jgi:tocopherol cyclase
MKKEINFHKRKLLPFYELRKIGNTILFQGNNQQRNYFEGWYFKMVSHDKSSILSVIPGISLSYDGLEQHAFIQTINGVTAETKYYTFPIEDFWFSANGFSIRIGNNHFSKERIILDLADQHSFVKGEVEMSNMVRYDSGTILNPGIMGWYRFVPFMECYHGVVSLTHDLNGSLSVDGDVFDFTKGKGYIEKDWGSSMPSAWIWMQSNHFSNPNSSFMLSVADIPWIGKSFTGFIGFFHHDNKTHHFATYRSSELQLEIPDTTTIELTIKNRQNTFLVRAVSRHSGLLKAPVEGSMDRRIAESIDATLHITMLDKKGNILHTDSSTVSGLELVGDLQNLKNSLK